MTGTSGAVLPCRPHHNVNREAPGILPDLIQFFFTLTGVSRVGYIYRTVGIMIGPYDVACVFHHITSIHSTDQAACPMPELSPCYDILFAFSQAQETVLSTILLKYIS